MKKYFLTIALLIFCFTSMMAQNSINTDDGVITGKTDVHIFERAIGYQWFKDGYSNYKPNPSAVEAIRTRFKNCQVVVFAGTWCEDTQTLLPQFYKAIDLAGIPKNAVVLYMLDREKHSTDGTENIYNVTKIPSFIIIQNGVEIGRITETVSQSIEADLADLLPAK